MSEATRASHKQTSSSGSAARQRTAVGSCASKYSSWLTTASAVKSSTWHRHEEKEEHRLSAHSLCRRLVRLWPKREAWLIGFLPVTLCVRRACVPRKTMRCRMSSAMGSVGPPASMKRGVMGGASALAPPARLCPAPAPAHGTHSSLWALSEVRPARGNNTRLRDAGRHRAWRVEEENRGQTREGRCTAAQRMNAPPARAPQAARPRTGWTLRRRRGPSGGCQRGRGHLCALRRWRRSVRLWRSSRPATSQLPRRMPRRCVPVPC